MDKLDHAYMRHIAIWKKDMNDGVALQPNVREFMTFVGEHSRTAVRDSILDVRRYFTDRA